MKLGLLVPQMGIDAGPAAIRDMAQAAEECGFGSLWVTDHLVMPGSYESEYPYNERSRLAVKSTQPYYEMFTTLGFLAAATRSVELGVAVCIVPYRHPVLLSKMISTIDQLCEGRFIFGAGVGWLAEEFEALGVDFTKRGALTNETLDFLKASWSPSQPVAFDGGLLQVRESYFSPGPFEGRDIPFWIGGDGAAALRRVALRGDAWFPHMYKLPPSRLVECVEKISELRVRAGRYEPVRTALFAPVALTDRDPGGAGDPWATDCLVGTPERIRQVLVQYRDVGVEHVLLALAGKPEDRLKSIRLLSETVIPDL